MTGAAEPDNDVIYHGKGSGAGGRPILIETPDGRHVGVLRHVVRHSPTGLSWGYGGSGPADTARSLLISALGADAMCRTCGGTGRLVFDPNAGEEPSAVPWDPIKPPQEYAARGLEVTQCWDWECDGGFQQLPYQAFKWEYVATWGDEFRISRTQIRAWLSQHQHQLAAKALGLHAEPDPKLAPKVGILACRMVSAKASSDVTTQAATPLGNKEWRELLLTIRG